MTAGHPTASVASPAAAHQAQAAEAAAFEAKYPLLKKAKASGLPMPPVEPPTFTLADVRAAIPAHCFERKLTTSVGYLALDLLKVALLAYAATWISHPTVPTAARVLLWCVYTAVQGTFLTGLWVLGHEMGHGAFSAIPWVNDAFGWVLHSSLLVPFFSWKFSHATHHKNTNSMEDDEVYVPVTRSSIAVEMINESPLFMTLYILGMLLFGWPLHILFDVSGPTKYHGRPNSHLNPWSVLFHDRQRKYVALSDVGLLFVLAGMAYLVSHVGVANFALFYGAPYLVMNSYLILITFLQHTDIYVAHYRAPAYSWLRGAIATVDRSYGSWVDAQIHERLRRYFNLLLTVFTNLTDQALRDDKVHRCGNDVRGHTHFRQTHDRCWRIVRVQGAHDQVTRRCGFKSDLC
ncbi:DUF3474 domain-containing protein, partial [archaeon]